MTTYYCVAPFHLELDLRLFEELSSDAPLFMRNMLDEEVRTFAPQDGDRAVYWVRATDGWWHPYLLLPAQTDKWYLVSLLPEAESHYLTLRMAATGVSGQVYEIPGVGYVGSKIHGVTLTSKLHEASIARFFKEFCEFTFPTEDV